MSDTHYRSALKTAIENADLKTVQTIIGEHQVPVDIKLNDSDTPLAIAASKGQFKIAEYLVQKGANVDHRNSNSNTVLMLASHYGHARIVKLLLKNGANISAVGNGGNTAIQWAHGQNQHDIVKLLKKVWEHGLQAIEDDHDVQNNISVDTWTKVSDTEIEHIYYRQSGNLRITDLFNFADKERTRYTQDVKTSTMISDTRNFSEMEGIASLKQAFSELKAQGGAPDSNAIGQFRTIKRRKKTSSKPAPPKT